MTQYTEIGPDGKVRIVRVDPNGDKSRRKIVRRKDKDSKSKDK
jgi:hypothetical protein